MLKQAYILHEPSPPPPPPHPFFTEWLCTVLGLLIPLGERIIFRDLVYWQRLLKSQALHILLIDYLLLIEKFKKFVVAVL